MTLNPDLPESESMFADVTPPTDEVQRSRQGAMPASSISADVPIDADDAAKSQVWTVVAIAVSSVLGLVALITLIWEALRPV